MIGDLAGSILHLMAHLCRKELVVNPQFNTHSIFPALPEPYIKLIVLFVTVILIFGHLIHTHKLKLSVFLDMISTKEKKQELKDFETQKRFQ